MIGAAAKKTNKNFPRHPPTLRNINKYSLKLTSLEKNGLGIVFPSHALAAAALKEAAVE